MAEPAIAPYTIADLHEVVRTLKRPTNGLLAKFFPTQRQSTAQFISFDVDEQKRYVAPFVHHRARARRRAARGTALKTFVPAYIKQATPFDPSVAFTRAAGESFGGSLTPQQRGDLAVSNALQDQSDAVDRRMELMAVEALKDGKVSVTGEDYPTQVLDYQRHASLGGAAAAGDRWLAANAATVDPADFVDKMSAITTKLASQATPTIVLDNVDAWPAFKKLEAVKKHLDIRNVNAGQLTVTSPQTEGLMYRGQYMGYDIWTYAGYVLNDAETEDVDVLAGGWVMGVGDIAGIQHFGAIHDWKAIREGFANAQTGLVEVPIFAKSYERDDPSEIVLETQAAPFVGPRRVNASWAKKLL